MAKIELEWGCLKVSVGTITVRGKTGGCLFYSLPLEERASGGRSSRRKSLLTV